MPLHVANPMPMSAFFEFQGLRVILRNAPAHAAESAYVPLWSHEQKLQINVFGHRTSGPSSAGASLERRMIPMTTSTPVANDKSPEGIGSPPSGGRLRRGSATTYCTGVGPPVLRPQASIQNENPVYVRPSTVNVYRTQHWSPGSWCLLPAWLITVPMTVAVGRENVALTRDS